MNPPNLKALYGRRYRVTMDEASESRDDIWMMQIPCVGQGVMLYRHGEGLLALQCDGRPIMAKRLLALGLTLVQGTGRRPLFSRSSGSTK